MEMDIAMNTQHILVLTGPDYEDLELCIPNSAFWKQAEP